MKLSVRFADQIVGALIILAMGILVFVIFMLGINQRWFSRDYNFKTYFPTASGLSKNMAVQYKGFTIGRVKSFDLVGEQVEVHFTVFDTYIDRVRNGSLVEVLTSPIGSLGGNQFIFYPGTGKELVPEGEAIPAVNSAEGRRLLALGLALRPDRDDSVNNILNSLNALLVDMQEAFQGTERTSLGRTMGGLEQAASGLQHMANKLPADLESSLNRIMTQLEPLLVNLHEVSGKLANPDGSIASILDPDGDVYQDLVESLDALAGTLKNLEKGSEAVPSQISRLSAMITDAQDVLTSAKSSRLLQKGLPEHKEAHTGGASARDMEF